MNVNVLLDSMDYLVLLELWNKLSKPRWTQVPNISFSNKAFCKYFFKFSVLNLKQLILRTSSVTACSVGVFWFTGLKSSRQLSGLSEPSRRPEREFSPFWMKPRWGDSLLSSFNTSPEEVVASESVK